MFVHLDTREMAETGPMLVSLDNLVVVTKMTHLNSNICPSHNNSNSI